MPEYIKCPLCELNYILPEQICCDLCKAGSEDSELDNQFICPFCYKNAIGYDDIMCPSCYNKRMNQ